MNLKRDSVRGTNIERRENHVTKIELRGQRLTLENALA
jgi:hypothetical protein